MGTADGEGRVRQATDDVPVAFEGMPRRARATDSRRTVLAEASRQEVAPNGRSCIAIAPYGGVSRPLKTSESVARLVVRDIIAGHLQPGDGLMSESAMLERFGVSRESLREGLRLLEVQGLITIRRGPGGGPVVGTVDPAHLGRISTLYYHLAGATYRELCEAWVVADGMLAERAARNPDGEARKVAMAPFLADEEREDLDTDEFVEHHSRFHGAVAALGQNRVLELTLQSMGHIVAHHSIVTGDPRRLRDVIEADHHGIAEAIAAGHAKRARTLAEDHLRGVSMFGNLFAEGQLDEYIEWL
jgi:GntR family transcriptional regulator, transcriptional repressor for pyruvate dehydrogenase complex